MNELKRHKKSDKIKWIFTGIAFLLIAVMLAGVGLQLFGTGKQKPSEWFGKAEEEPIKVVFEDFGVGHHGSDSRNGLYFHADTLATIESQIKKNGYFDILIELKGVDPKEELRWELWMSSHLGNDINDYLVITVDENDDTKALLRIKELPKLAEWGDSLYLNVYDSSEEFSAIFLDFDSIESFGIIVI